MRINRWGIVAILIGVLLWYLLIHYIWARNIFVALVSVVVVALWAGEILDRIGQRKRNRGKK